MSNKQHLSPFVPMVGKDRYGHKITKGCTNPCFLGGRGKWPEKNHHFEHKQMGSPVLSAP